MKSEPSERKDGFQVGRRWPRLCAGLVFGSGGCFSARYAHLCPQSVHRVPHQTITLPPSFSEDSCFFLSLSPTLSQLLAPQMYLLWSICFTSNTTDQRQATDLLKCRLSQTHLSKSKSYQPWVRAVFLKGDVWRSGSGSFTGLRVKYLALCSLSLCLTVFWRRIQRTWN